MKCVVICLLFVGLAVATKLPVLPTPATDEGRGCRYIMGRCAEACPVGTHAYTTGCGYKTPEATCKNPTPVPETRGKICDFSSCYCDSPTVRDEKTHKCVPLDQCT